MSRNNSSSPGDRATLLIGSIVAMVAVVAGVWLGASAFRDAWQPPGQPELQQGTLLTEPRALAAFELTDQDGMEFGLERLRGHWTFVSFGYTSCPDVCPMTLATLGSVERTLDAEGDRKDPLPELLFVSVDPARDTPRKLGPYVRYFSPRLTGATGSDEQLRALAAQLGVMYAKVAGEDTALGYLVDHSASILLIDPQGRLAAVFSTPHDAQRIAADFLSIIQHHPS